MLGFCTILLFNQVGFNVVTNIIWDKGEVESKRNSTSNLFSGYVNPVNSYEHCFVFSKNNKRTIMPTEVKKINAVKKINFRGENTLGHTAPFPNEIAELLIPFLDTGKDGFVIDPFLGSGTTSVVMEKNNIKNIGVEIDKKYFEIACRRVREASTDLI